MNNDTDEDGRWTPTDKELREILQAHERWLESDGEDGKQANLSEADLQGRNFSGANLEAADLSGANLANATLTGATFQASTLQNATLTGVEGLEVQALRQANLSGAELPPDISDFEGLQRVEKGSQYARKLFLAIIVACTYSWFDVITMTDAELILNRGASQLPIVETNIPHVGFFWVGPAVLLLVYVYFHLHLQRLWEELATLPSIFPDGRPLDKKADPWLLLGFVRAHIAHLKNQHRPFFSLQKWTIITIAWWLVPITLLVFALRYLPKHDVQGTLFHAFLGVGAVWFAFSFYRNASGVLRGKPKPPFIWKTAWKDWRTLPVLIFALAFYFFPYSSSIGELEQQFPKARLQKTDLRGADLRWADLENARFEEVDLRHSNLQYADLFAAWIRESVRLDSANLSMVGLKDAQAQRVSFEGANLSHAWLLGADIQRSNLANANLSDTEAGKAFFLEANLSSAELTGAELWGADFRKADLTGANLQGAALSYESITDTTSTKGVSESVRNIDWVLVGDSHRVFTHFANRREVKERKVAKLGEATLKDATLQNADLRGAEVTAKQLCSAKTLQGVKLDEMVRSNVEERCSEKLR